MKSRKCDTLAYDESELISVPHCFTTRLGGVSTGALESLNIGIHRGDSPENVMENYRILGKALGFSPEDTIFTKQVHGSEILTVGLQDRGTGLFRPQQIPCDGLITNAPGAVLVVFTADCTPILLHDPVTGAVGAVHAGWRGTALGIAGKAVERMCAEFGCRAEDIRAAIGPNIGACCFETNADVPEAMQEAFGADAGPFIVPTGEKFHVDLKGINAMVLKKAGVTRIDISTECTACRNDRYWSHRITGGNRGSQGAVIVCRGAGV